VRRDHDAVNARVCGTPVTARDVRGENEGAVAAVTSRAERGKIMTRVSWKPLFYAPPGRPGFA
jgi:hypothetical protein